MFCERSKKSLNDPDLFVSRVLRKFYIAGFACIQLFYQPCVQRSGLSITGHGRLHSFCRTRDRDGDFAENPTELSSEVLGLAVEGQIYPSASNGVTPFSPGGSWCAWPGPHAIVTGDDFFLPAPQLWSGSSQPVNFCVPGACGKMQRDVFLSLSRNHLQKGTVQLFVPC